MAIYKKENVFYIHSADMSIIIEEHDSHLLLRHIGKKVKQYNRGNAVVHKDHAFSANPDAWNRTYSYDTQRLVVGTHGLGDFRLPSILIQHDNNAVVDFKYVDYEITSDVVQSSGLPNPFSEAGISQTLKLYLEDKVANLRLTINFTTYEDSNTISTFSEVENIGTEAVFIHKIMSAMLDLPSQDMVVHTFQGAYGREKTYRSHDLSQGIFEISSSRGASGHGQTPSVILSTPETNESSGEALAVQLMYSGNFEMKVQRNQLDEIRLLTGINEDNFMWELKAKENFSTPVALLTYSDQGLTGISQASHQFVREHIIPNGFANKIRPILINNWEATYFDFNQEKLLNLAEAAAETGIELFVLDDGWFGDRKDDNRALGDWVVNEDKIQGSLDELIEQINKLGLDFGLWVEPEMISENSELYKNHPEWVIQVPNRNHTYSRNQLVLDLSNAEVVHFIKTTLDNLLSRHNISYIKWDMNRNITNVGNGATYQDTMEQSHRYMLGLYEVLEYLSGKYPEVLFESCAGGGGRNDLGMMRYFPQVWSSDNTDAIERLNIQYGTSYLYPSITMGAHVSVVPNHQVNRVTPLATRGDVAMMGNLGYELDLTKLSKEELAVISQQVGQYKNIRETIQLGTQYRLINPTSNTNEVAVQYIDDQQIVVTYVRILSAIEKMETTLKLKALDQEAAYQLQGSNQLYTGEELMYAGLTMDLPSGDFLSKQLVLKKM